MGRPQAPVVMCSKCSEQVGSAVTVDKAEDTALHIGSPNSELGIVFIRATCHGETQDIGATFKWLAARRDGALWAFDNDDYGKPRSHSYGIKEMIELDGIALPPEAKTLEYQSQGWSGRLELKANDTDTQLEFVNRRFLQAMERELRDNPETRAKTSSSPRTLARLLAEYSREVADVIRSTGQKAIPTSDITVRTARLAVICMKIFEQIGTPEFAPKENIADALPNSTKRGLPTMRKLLQ